MVMKRPLCVLAFLFALQPCFARQSNPQQASPGGGDAVSTATIPGPLRSFLRMSAISQKVNRDEVLPLLARNVSVQGYQDGKATEFLVLLRRYLDQARELVVMAGPDGVIKVTTCNDAKPLLAILGYRMRDTCGPKAAVETSDPDRAFLTIDSGFPLAELEETLRTGKAFSYAYPSSQVPSIFAQDDWIIDDKIEPKKEKGRNDPIDALLRDPQQARIYWAMSRIDADTVKALRQNPGIHKLLADSAVLDFYGSQISIRGGRVVVPGGQASENAWKDLVGASPQTPADFVSKLAVKDEGWAAVYFDVLSRLNARQQAYFADPKRLSRFYEALRGKDLSPSPSRPVFRPDPGLLLLATRLRLDASGQPQIPGNVQVWKEIVEAHKKDDSKIAKELAKDAGRWNNAEQVVQGMFGLSRVTASNNALSVFLTISEMDRDRPAEQRLTPATVRLLADKFGKYSQQYPMLSEFPELSNASLARFVAAADSVDKVSDHNVRSNAMGIFQANFGIWEALARQGEIPAAKLNDSWMRWTEAFTTVKTPVELFDAGRTSLTQIVSAAAGKESLSQDEIIALLAGPNQLSPEGLQVKQEIAGRIRTVMDDQRLLSLDTLFALADGLNQMSQGKPAPDNLLAKAQELREFEMPRPFFTTTERSEWAAGLYNTSHATLQMRTDLTKVIKTPGSPAELGEARGQLAPLLRDTLVGLNYAYYEPPAAQALHNNPLLVRSHDFTGEMTPGAQQAWQIPRVFGRGWTASGGAHLTGSLADLPYVLAQMEQDFTVPENVQALIWDEMVPSLMSSAIVPRWWGVTHNELHAVSLYQKAGEEILNAAAKDDKLRETAMSILAERMLSERIVTVDDELRAGRAKELIPQITPAEAFYLGTQFRRRYPGQGAVMGDPGKELEALANNSHAEVSLERLSRDFGVPHPALEQNYSRELLDVKPFPAFMGFPSRLLAETWDSDNLYWARIADEMGLPPEALNTLAPQLTHRMVEKIFATDFEDWPAVLRAMHEAGDEYRRGENAVAVPAADANAANPQAAGTEASPAARP